MIQHEKEKEYQAMKRRGGTLNVTNVTNERSQYEKYTYCGISTL